VISKSVTVCCPDTPWFPTIVAFPSTCSGATGVVVPIPTFPFPSTVTTVTPPSRRLTMSPVLRWSTTSAGITALLL
jgi:hypothetical protein